MKGGSDVEGGAVNGGYHSPQMKSHYWRQRKRVEERELETETLTLSATLNRQKKEFREKE